MADTQRSLNDLLTALFQDAQPDNSITAQSIRDAIVSLGKTPYGGIFTLTPVETVISSAGVYVKGACQTQVNNARNFDMPADNRLRYIGLIPFHMHIAVSLSMTSAGSNLVASFKLFRFDDSEASGALIDGSRVNRHIATGTDEGSTALHWDVILETNDYLELHIANLTNVSNITLTNLYLFAMGMPI